MYETRSLLDFLTLERLLTGSVCPVLPVSLGDNDR